MVADRENINDPANRKRRPAIRVIHAESRTLSFLFMYFQSLYENRMVRAMASSTGQISSVLSSGQRLMTA